jgi:hypothetical protein
MGKTIKSIKIRRKVPQLHITGLFTLRPLRRPGVQSARSFASLIPTPLTHIASPRNPTGCFIGGWQRRIQPERYVQFCQVFVNFVFTKWINCNIIDKTDKIWVQFLYFSGVKK